MNCFFMVLPPKPKQFSGLNSDIQSPAMQFSRILYGGRFCIGPLGAAPKESDENLFTPPRSPVLEDRIRMTSRSFGLSPLTPRTAYSPLNASFVGRWILVRFIRDIFRFAYRHNASALIVAHNHPSGNLKPSDQDHEITLRLAQAAPS